MRIKKNSHILFAFLLSLLDHVDNMVRHPGAFEIPIRRIVHNGPIEFLTEEFAKGQIVQEWALLTAMQLIPLVRNNSNLELPGINSIIHHSPINLRSHHNGLAVKLYLRILSNISLAFLTYLKESYRSSGKISPLNCRTTESAFSGLTTANIGDKNLMLRSLAKTCIAIASSIDPNENFLPSYRNCARAAPVVVPRILGASSLSSSG